MPVYHSQYNEKDGEFAEACGCAILPMKTKLRGPAPTLPLDSPEEDIVDEILTLFRANVLFTNFEIKGNADRTLVYGILYTHFCLKEMTHCQTKNDALRVLQQNAVENFAIPGEPSFPLGGMVRAPSSATESDTIRGYFRQLREAIALRIVEKVFTPEGTKSKWWMLFAKRKFMNKELTH